MGWLAIVVLAQLGPSPVVGLTATATASEFAGPGAPRLEAPVESTPNSAPNPGPAESTPNSAVDSRAAESTPNSASDSRAAESTPNSVPNPGPAESTPNSAVDSRAAESTPNSAPNPGPAESAADSKSKPRPDRYKDLPVAEPISLYRNPGGKFQVSGGAGFGIRGGAGRFTVAAGLGYGIVDGVLPGVRGLVVLGQVVGAELAATLTLTPPVAWQVTPFAVGEVGRRFQSGFSGWIYGAGGGVYLGQPGSVIGFQLGYIWRRLSVPGLGSIDASTPLVNVSARF